MFNGGVETFWEVRPEKKLEATTVVGAKGRVLSRKGQSITGPDGVCRKHTVLELMSQYAGFCGFHELIEGFLRPGNGKDHVGRN
jgi:hypothetical protein